MKANVLLYATLSALSLLPVSGLQAQEKILLRVADYVPNTHVVYQNGLNPFIEAVEKKSSGRIEFQYYPSEQLGKSKELLGLVSSGAVDIANVAPSYTSEKMPLTTVSQLPGLYMNSCEGTQALLSETSADGVLGKEFEENNILTLLPFMFQPPDLLIANETVFAAEDWQGMKIRVAGGAPEIAVVGLGGVPVRMGTNDIYQSLSRGTIDAALLPAASAKPYGLDEAITSMTTGFSLGSNASIYVINTQAWERLPEDLRVILKEAGEEAATTLCAALDEQERSEIANMEANGIKITRLDDAARHELRDALPAMHAEWAKRISVSTDEIEKIFLALQPRK